MDWSAIISGAAAGALVAAVGAVIAARINVRSQERITALNHEHEAALQVMDDRRRLRDVKLDRLRQNLEKLADTTLEVHTNVIYFIRNPDNEYKDVLTHAARMNDLLIGVRGKILVDAESVEVMSGLNDAYRRYQALGDAWADYRTAQQRGEPGAAEMGKTAREEAVKLLHDLEALLDKPREILAKFEQPVTPRDEK